MNLIPIRANMNEEELLAALKRVQGALERGGLRINEDKLFPTGGYALKMEIAQAIAKAERR